MSKNVLNDIVADIATGPLDKPGHGHAGGYRRVGVKGVKMPASHQLQAVHAGPDLRSFVNAGFDVGCGKAYMKA